jgi:hypothetical protein
LALADGGDQVGPAGRQLTAVPDQLVDQRPSVSSSLERHVLRRRQFSQMFAPGKAAKLECLEHGTRGEPDDRTGNVLGMRYPVDVLIV